MQLREQARQNHARSGSTQPLPKSVTDEPPPRPEPYQEEEMADVSVDITANGFDASESFTLDRSMADDIVPASDPGIDRPTVSSQYSNAERILTVAGFSSGTWHTRQPASTSWK
jgi:serine/threonine-protein phosphatase 2A regulatory subunit B'